MPDSLFECIGRRICRSCCRLYCLPGRHLENSDPIAELRECLQGCPYRNGAAQCALQGTVPGCLECGTLYYSIMYAQIWPLGTHTPAFEALCARSTEKLTTIQQEPSSRPTKQSNALSTTPPSIQHQQTKDQNTTHKARGPLSNYLSNTPSQSPSCTASHPAQQKWSLA